MNDDHRGGQMPVSEQNIASIAQLQKTMNGLEAASERFGRSLAGALKTAVVDGKALDGVLRGLVLRLSDEAIKVALAPISDQLGSTANGVAGSLGTGLAGLFKGLFGFAKGGVVSAPTFFPMGGGNLGVAGEAGSEAILPLARGADGRLGVRAGGGGGVNVTFNVKATDADSFRRSESQVTAMLARAVGRGRRGL